MDAFGPARGENDINALGREPFRDREPDADAAAGDDGHLTLEFEIHDPLFLSPAGVAAIRHHDRPGHQAGGV